MRQYIFIHILAQITQYANIPSAVSHDCQLSANCRPEEEAPGVNCLQLETDSSFEIVQASRKQSIEIRQIQTRA